MTDTVSPPISISRLALVGEPNAGKTTLFNRMCGVRHRTSNYPGTTQEYRVGHWQQAPGVEVTDLPGVYALDAPGSEADVCRRALEDQDAVIFVLDVTEPGKASALLEDMIECGARLIVACNMSDLVDQEKLGLRALEEALGCPVVACSAMTGAGFDVLSARLDEAAVPRPGVQVQGVLDAVYSAPARRFDLLDRTLTSSLLGIPVFAAMMLGLFMLVFKVASYPMDWIDGLFGWLGTTVSAVMPEGLISQLLVDGIIAGVGATVIFLPQICLLLFVLSILEDTGYLARAALLIDRMMRPFGLTGQSFVPLLSAHACALPAITACRGISDVRARLATVLVAPFMSCTARIPVYVLLTVILFPERPFMQALAFAGCYVLGIFAGLVSALLARGTIIRGRGEPMLLELPPYRRPSVRTAALTAWDKGWGFLRKAGTMILAASIILWWAGTFPKGTEEAPRESVLEVVGGAVQPVFEPLGFDDQLTVGVLASLAARELFATTLSVQIAGSDEVDSPEIVDRMANATRRDSDRLVFDPPTSWALLVYYVFAMQCLPTTILTAREVGWRWSALQLGWMFAMAWVGGAIAFAVTS